jgi:hypothetical protein
VRLRVTLSYFIEPNPGRRGWKKRHRYASHGLRFAVKSATESLDEFRKRVNQQALDEDEDRPRAGGDVSDWFLGEQIRNKGSLHSDIWVGSAADLAERGVVGIYPVSGWWKDQPNRSQITSGEPANVGAFSPYASHCRNTCPQFPAIAAAFTDEFTSVTRSRKVESLD